MEEGKRTLLERARSLVRRGVAKIGVVADIPVGPGGADGPLVALRAP